MRSRYFPETFIKSCSDGGYYFFRQIDDPSLGLQDTMFWYGESGGLSFANIFMGRLIQDGDEDRWIGRFWDIPKGNNCGYGTIEVRSQFDSIVWPLGPFWGLRKVSSSASFGGDVWGLPYYEELDRNFGWQGGDRGLSMVNQAGFRGRGAANLTGTWKGDDGGRYYIHDLPDTNEFVWFAEHPTAYPTSPRTFGDTEVEVRAAQGWANVFVGERSGTRIEGVWADVPKGLANRYGRLELVLENPYTLRVTNQVGGYRGTILRRHEDLMVDIEFPQLDIHQIMDRDSRYDDPRLYLYLVVLDGLRLDHRSAYVQFKDTGWLADEVRPYLEIRLSSELNFTNIHVRSLPGVDPLDPGEPGIWVALYAENVFGESERWDRIRDATEAMLERHGRSLYENFTSDIVGGRSYRFDYGFLDYDFYVSGRHSRSLGAPRSPQDLINPKVWSFAELTQLEGSSYDFVMPIYDRDGGMPIEDGSETGLHIRISVRSRYNPDCYPLRK